MKQSNIDINDLRVYILKAGESGIGVLFKGRGTGAPPLR